VPLQARRDLRKFLESTIHSVDSFSGDLSWLRENLSTFAALIDRQVRVRILIDTPNDPAIRKHKTRNAVP